MAKANRIGVLWQDRPWIGARVIGSTIEIGIIAVVLTWAEFLFGVFNAQIFNMPLIFWTFVVLFLVWFFLILRSLLIKVSSLYTLRETSLEVETGIGNKRTIIVSSSGFADLTLTRTIGGRILDVGNIVVRSEGEKDVYLNHVRHPVEVSNKIRDTMTRPVVRLGNESQPGFHR
jgi:hypothetical protein